MKIDVIIPLYNEEDNVYNMYKKVKEELGELKYNIIFVNDGSSDKTFDKLKVVYNEDSERVKVVNFSRNFGKEAAMYAGLENSTGDYVCIIDGDLQQDPSYIVKMYKYLEEHHDYDAICLCQKQNKKRFLQSMFYKLMRNMSELRSVDGASDFRMFRRPMVNAILMMTEKNRFSKGIFDYVGFNTRYDTYNVKARTAGVTKWSTSGLFKYAFNGIIAFSTKPLRFATYTGLLTSFSAFVYLIYIIAKTIVTGVDTPGYASVMCVMLFLGGIQLIFLGIIGEYLGKTYNETKARPIYIAKDKLGFDEDFL